MHLIGQTDNVVPMNIGLQIPGRDNPPAEPLKLILPSSQVPTETQVVDAQGEPTSSMTWPRFVGLRQFSCMPRIVDRASLDAFVAVEGIDDEEFLSALIREEQREDVLQATVEFVGECGELSELVSEHGVPVLWGDRRPKLIDECGDILFTGAWLIDAWCRNPYPVKPEEEPGSAPSLASLFSERPIPNPLLEATDTELYLFEEGDIHAQLAVHIINHGGMRLMKDRGFLQTAAATLVTDVTRMLSFAALTANAAKKHAYQFREQDARAQVDRVLGAFFAVNFILCVANSSVEEAMVVNRKKIDARYPEGYKPGVGGGIRTEG